MNRTQFAIHRTSLFFLSLFAPTTEFFVVAVILFGRSFIRSEIYACDFAVRCLLLVKHSSRFFFSDCDKGTVFLSRGSSTLFEMEKDRQQDRERTRRQKTPIDRMVIVSLYALCKINAVWDSMVLDWSFQPFLSMARARYAKRILHQSLLKRMERERSWERDRGEQTNETEICMTERTKKRTAIHWKRKTAVMIHLHMLQMVMRHVNIALFSSNKAEYLSRHLTQFYAAIYGPA